MSNTINELAKMAYELTNGEQVHVVIHSLPNDWGHIKMVMCRTKYILNFEHIRRRLKLEEKQQKATKMTSAEVHMSTSNSRNGCKRKNQENQIGMAKSNKGTEYDQQGKEIYATKKDLMQSKCLNSDQMGHDARDCTKPKKVLSNNFQ